MLDILNKYYEGGWLIKQTHPILPLTIWNYSQTTQYEGKWDEVTTICRGLVTDNKGKIVARPFKKFHNMEENKHTPTPEFEVFEKMDGSLGIMFLYNNELICATRGSFTSDQAKWMADFAKKHNYKDIIVDGFTYLFEIIYPENRIVVEYNGQERLVLLGIIKTETGKEILHHALPFEEFDVVKKYDGIKDYSILKKLVDNNQEGFVIRFSNGDRMKIKGEEYIRLHRIMTEVSTTSIWEILSNGDNMEDLLKDVPDEFYYKIKEYVKDLAIRFDNIRKDYIQYYIDIVFKVGIEDRKSFASEARRYNHPSILFNLLDKKDVNSIIWKIIKPKFKKL
jgi:RNA ligase